MKRVFVFLLLTISCHLYGQESIVDLLEKKGVGKNTYAIIIANEDYQSYSAKYIENEELAIYQAERFEQLLIKKLHVPSENIQFYSDAVNTNIKLAIAKLKKGIQENANLIFYYRGKTFTDSIKGKFYLVPVDVSNDETFYMLGLEDLFKRLNLLNTKEVDIFLDVFNSGKTGKSCILENGCVQKQISTAAQQKVSVFMLKAPINDTVKAKLPIKGVKPEISVTDPSSKISDTKELNILIKGRVKSDCKIEIVAVNGQEAHTLEDGSFTAKIPLHEGVNIISIEGKNCAGWTRDSIVISQSSLMSDQEDIADSLLFFKDGTLKELGRNFALIIGVSKYIDPIMPDLFYPVSDARKVKDVLIQNYTFDAKDVILLENPHKETIVKTLDSINRIINSKDNLLVFYAGHGAWDEKASMGYWLPSDAAANAIGSWIMNSIITGYVSQSNARHTLIIADACFGGSIFRTRAFKREEDKTIAGLYLKTSRKAMTSGDLTEVPDESIFIKNFVLILSENKESYLSSEKLFFGIKPKIINSADLIPQFGIIKNAGDRGGDFIFFRK